MTAIPGTTRDLLTERADIGGLSLSLIDTAGVRETSDVVEQEGVSRARAAVGVADLTIVLLDRSRPLSNDDRELLGDHGVAAARGGVEQDRSAAVATARTARSCRSGRDLGDDGRGHRSSDRRDRHKRSASGEELRDRPQVTNVRHAVLLERARESLTRAAAALESEVSEEFPLLDLQEAGAALQEITGKRTTDDLLRHIFERFCIGK